MVDPIPGADISIENQRVEVMLLESEEHYRAVAQASTDAIITIDSESTRIAFLLGTLFLIFLCPFYCIVE